MLPALLQERHESEIFPQIGGFKEPNGESGVRVVHLVFPSDLMGGIPSEFIQEAACHF